MSDTTKATHWSNLREECAFLWLQRDHAVRAPNVRLINLARADARLDAYLAALRPAVASVLASEPDATPGATFCEAFLAIEAGNLQAVDQLMHRPQQHELIAALCMAAQPAATVVIDRLRAETADPVAQVLHLAASGGRRRSPRGALDDALSHPEASVRARAYRSVGQLGLIDHQRPLLTGLQEEDAECRFWAAWAAARMGADEPVSVLADIAWNNSAHADDALDILLRRLEVGQANAWLRELARLPERQRSLLRATGVIGDPLYVPWLIERMAEPAAARLSGEAFSMITGVDLAYSDLVLRPPPSVPDEPNDDPADENVALDEDAYLSWPDPGRVGQWWSDNRGRFTVGTGYFLGTPKDAADWLGALSDGYQRQRHAAALELAIRQPGSAMFETRARARLQRQLLVRARGT